jgi:HEAT repeat protein
MDRATAGTETLEELIGPLLEEDETARYETARQIARRGREVIPRVIELTHDQRPRMREMAAYILGQVGCPDPADLGWLIRYPDGIPTLIHLLVSDPDEDVRAVSAYALGFHRAPGSIPALCHVGSDPCPDVREAVASALGSCSLPAGDEELSRHSLDRLRATLLRLADDEDDEVRNWATFGLRHEEHNTPQVRARLWQALDDPYTDVRGEAAEALAGFGDRSLIPRLECLLREDKAISPGYFVAAEELGDPCVLPAVLDGAERWRATMEEGEEMHFMITSAIEALQQAVEQQAKD